MFTKTLRQASCALFLLGMLPGAAVAALLAGDFSPAGRLPLTFYQSIDQLPAFDDYTMSKRTYRYFAGEPLYPFAHG